MKERTRSILFFLVVLGALGAWTLYRNHAYTQQAAALPDDSVVGKGRPVLLELGAPWCTYCRQMMPVLSDLAQAHGEDFTVAAVNVDENPAAQQRYRVGPIPLLIFFDGEGTVLYRHEGYLPKDRVLEKWQDLGIMPDRRAGDEQAARNAS